MQAAPLALAREEYRRSNIDAPCCADQAMQQCRRQKHIGHGASHRTASTLSQSHHLVAGSDSGAKELGLVYLGIAGPEGVAVTYRRFLGDRERIRVFTTQAALDLLRWRLEGLGSRAGTAPCGHGSERGHIRSRDRRERA
jgi:hypothetical protein